MKATLLTVKELAQRWNVSEPTIRRMENERKIKRVQSVSGVKFNLTDVLKIENNGQIDELSPFEIKKIKLENENLKKEISKYKNMLANIFACMGEYVQYETRKD